MKQIRQKMSCAILFLPMAMLGQNADSSFYTISEKSHIANVRETTIDSTSLSANTVDSMPASTNEASAIPLSSSKIEELLRLYREWINKRERKDETNVHNSRVISYYNGINKELTLSNLLEVMKEVGLSNRLIVLAQAVLETGNFSSKVCKQYNNLFGLYDSRHHDYYRFEKWEDSVVAYQKFIQYRYKGGNYFQFLKRIGYAEDRHYISKVAKIAKQLYNRLIESETK